MSTRDYQEDQKNELEALESIYFEELESKCSLMCVVGKIYNSINLIIVLDEEDRNKFKINVCTDGFRETDDGLCCDLIFEYKSKYPDVPPNLEIDDDNFESADVKRQLTETINQTIEENIGMEMIFSIVGAAQELLNTLFDQIKSDRELQKERKEKEKEELERKKFEGNTNMLKLSIILKLSSFRHKSDS